MFTSIKALYASPAQRDRVATVEKWLQKQSTMFHSDLIFPIFAIGNSNSVDDVDWVVGHKSCHIAWPELESAVLAEINRSIADTTQLDAAQHMEKYVRDMNRSKVKTIAELTELYNKAQLALGIPQAVPVLPAVVDTPVVAEVKASTETVTAATSELGLGPLLDQVAAVFRSMLVAYMEANKSPSTHEGYKLVLTTLSKAAPFNLAYETLEESVSDLFHDLQDEEDEENDD
jgi:hypothetical protein